MPMSCIFLTIIGWLRSCGGPRDGVPPAHARIHPIWVVVGLGVEVAEEVGLRPSSVHYQLRELETKGAIVREPGRPRGIRLA
ncbi:hypothetical protein [Streptomyces rochei]|uniref:LexA family protein n=1 Tax=Streptomyces rochei TaxID=1928 RepID=UPI003530DB73